MLEINSLTKYFTLGGGILRTGLRGVNLHVEKGEFVTIIGSNGAGKSTLLNAIAGVFPCDEGSIFIDGKDVTRLPEYRRAPLIGRVFQDPLRGTAASMSIEENLAMAGRRGQRRGLGWGVTSRQREEFIRHLRILGLGLENRLSDPVGLLSGGERQALTLIMATLAGPKILLLDEHTAALDPKTAELILALTERVVAENNFTVLMVTHNLRQALSMGTRTIMMHEGEIVLDVRDPQRGQMTVESLLAEFARVRGQALDDDRILLELSGQEGEGTKSALAN